MKVTLCLFLQPALMGIMVLIAAMLGTLLIKHTHTLALDFYGGSVHVRPKYPKTEYLCQTDESVGYNIHDMTLSGRFSIG